MKVLSPFRKYYGGSIEKIVKTRVKDCKNQSTRGAEERWYLLDCTHEISTMRLPKQGMENNNVSQYANMYTEDFYKVLPLSEELQVITGC